MGDYLIKEKTIPLDDSWDVIVAGGGPAGCTAAAAAAREGAKTLLIEATGCLGGMGTSGLVPSWCPFSDKEQIIYKGLAERIFLEAKRDIPNVKETDLDWVPIDSERLKRIYDDLMDEFGVTVLYNTFLSSVEAEHGGSVSTLIISNKAGLSALKAKVYIDCTGDADLAVWAGAQYKMGSDGSGEVQPSSLCFTISGVDEQAYGDGRMHREDGPVRDIVESGRYPEVPDYHFCNSLVGHSTVGFNAGHLWEVDNTDPYSVSKALPKGRRLAHAIHSGLMEFFPEAFGNSYLVSTAPLMGIRETRRIVGDYSLTVKDYLQRRSFKDEICRNNYPIDIHNTVDEIEQVKTGEVRAMERYEQYSKGESHGIPYRCLTPLGLSNVLVAGRSISCDRDVQASVRVMPVCLAMGEAAGIAGAIAAEMPEADVHAVDVKRLQKRLIEHGGYILPEE